MKPGAYIKGSGVISPQKTFDKDLLESAFLQHSGNRWSCTEPDYSTFIDAKQIRRMSRIIKMSVTSSMLALGNAGIEKPEAVIVGTAFGCLDDTYAFLSKLVQFKEDMLSPTAFIHSTHNTIAAQIALHYKCYGYNSTYVHRSVSFESALADAIMLLEENSVSNILVGGADEIIDAGFTIMDRMGHFKNKDQINSGNLSDSKTTGTIAGEGAAFFSLTNRHTPDCLAKIVAVDSWSFLSDGQAHENIVSLLKQHNITSPSLILAGFNGDVREDERTAAFTGKFNPASGTFPFKNLCGEYGTSTAFATWMAATILKEQLVPGTNGFEKNTTPPINNILIYNQLSNIHHAVILLEAC